MSQLPGGPEPSTDGVVSDLYYIPTEDANGVLLTPVYVTVTEL